MDKGLSPAYIDSTGGSTACAHYRVRKPAQARTAGRLIGKILLWLCLVLQALPLTQAETLPGTPLLHRYLPEDYNATPQHLAITADQDGRLYVGNVEGVLRYDGQTWQLIRLPGKQIARAIAAGKDGRIYVGSYDSFGWLQISDKGDTSYQELLTAAGLQGRERAVGAIWQVIAGEAGVYFRAERSLHFLSYDRRTVKHWPIDDEVRSFYGVGKQLYARVAGRGFCRFIDGRFELEPGGQRFADQSLLAVIDHDGTRLLIGDRGMFQADAKGIEPLADDAGTQLRDAHAYDALPLPDGSFVVGTLRGELFHYGADYRLHARIDLGSYSIVALASDREGGLWVATEGDLIRMVLPSPWSFIGAAQGLPGTVNDFEWHENALWLATSHGFIRMSASPDARIQAEYPHWTELEAYSLAGTEEGLLMGHRKGLLVLDAGQKTPRTLLQSQSEGVYQLVASRLEPGRIYGLGEQHLFVLEQRQGRWQIGGMLPLDGASANSLQVVGPGVVWFGDARGGPQRWRLDPANGKVLEKRVFGQRDGLDLDEHAGSHVFVLDGAIHVISGERGFRYDGARFVADTAPPYTLIDRPDELDVEQTPLGTYAFSSRQLWFRPARQSQWQRLDPGSPLAAGFDRVRYNRDGVLRAATWSGLLQFDPREKQPVPAPLKLGFERVTVESADGQQTRQLPIASQDAPIEVPSGSRLHFRYGLVSMENGAEFRYMVHGITEQWSDWTDRDLFVRALTPGDYLLEVQARTRSGRLSAPASYRYRILPQWYERLWVHMAGWLLLAGLAILAVSEYIRRRTQRYLEANRLLESRIAERTQEIEQANRKLAELATEDPLTGVANRRALENGLQREWYRCLDQRHPLSALMIDVDHFKRYNDAYGHLEGDVLLRTIARSLHRLHDPKRELLARYGGEEFALLLPGVPAEQAKQRAEAIRQAMQKDIPQTTISVGVAGFVPSLQTESSQLLRRADAALYRAKRGGRNRVELDAE